MQPKMVYFHYTLTGSLILSLNDNPEHLEWEKFEDAKPTGWKTLRSFHPCSKKTIDGW
jgi:hypothetical protein